MNVEKQTEQLKKYLIDLKHRFENSAPPENRRDPEFFQLVKRETTPVFNLLETWEEITLEQVKLKQVKVHPHQVASTRENMELLLMHSYFFDARKKRYMDLYQSVLYIFDQILIKEEEK
ncbi:DUF1798 family protein [Oceanobacillus sp. CAU 1775]